MEAVEMDAHEESERNTRRSFSERDVTEYNSVTSKRDGVQLGAGAPGEDIPQRKSKNERYKRED